MIGDWVAENFGWLLLAALVGLGGLMTWAIHETSQEHARLMAQCMQDHKEYECEALLRSPEPQTVPVVVPVVVGR